MVISMGTHKKNRRVHSGDFRIQVPILNIRPVSEFLDETAGPFLKWALLIAGALAIGTLIGTVW
jgi:hypothetical protein